MCEPHCRKDTCGRIVHFRAASRSRHLQIVRTRLDRQAERTAPPSGECCSIEAMSAPSVRHCLRQRESCHVVLLTKRWSQAGCVYHLPHVGHDPASISIELFSGRTRNPFLTIRKCTRLTRPSSPSFTDLYVSYSSGFLHKFDCHDHNKSRTNVAVRLTPSFVPPSAPRNRSRVG